MVDEKAADELRISIHAPVKGATRQEALTILNYWKISIHAPVKGATRYDYYAMFNFFDISIHAPVKGATAYSDSAAGR